MENNIKILGLGNSLYSASLKDIGNPPKKLYYKGDVSLLSSPCLAMVGSRDCSNYGLQVARSFSKDLAKSGLVIVSGLALRN